MKRFISQREDNDCAIACAAMLSGETYEQARHILYPSYYRDRGTEVNNDFLEKFGYKRCEYLVEDREFPARFFTRLGRLKLLGKKTLFIVREDWHEPDGGHMVYWDGWRLHDPSPAQRNKKLKDLKHKAVTVFSLN